jgi:drug/metabolite transporter (DMT)-like permease
MGYLYAFMATLFWSGNAVAARFLADSVPALGISFWRWFAALLICAPITFPAFRREYPAVKRHWKYLTIMAFLGVALFNVLLYTAAQTTTAFNIAVISTVTPVIILVFSVIFAKERQSLANIAGFAIAVCGILFLITDGEPLKILSMRVVAGDVIMLAASFIFASYTVMVKMKPYGVSVNSMLFFTFHAGFLMLLPPYLVQEFFISGVPFGVPQIAGFLYIGVFASFVSYMFWNRAIAMIGASKAGGVYYSLPVFAGILGYFILGEVVTVTDMLSMALVGFGVYLTGKKV